LNFPDRFSKNTKISKCHVSSSGGNRVIPCGRTDGQTDTRGAANIHLFAMSAVRLRLLLLKSFPLKATKEQEGMDVQLHLSLTLVLDGCYWSASHPGGFTCGQHPPPSQHPFNRRQSGSRWSLDRFREEKYFLPVPGIEPVFLGCSAPNLVTVPTVLSLPQIESLKDIIHFFCIVAYFQYLGCI